jgi:SAM-dependent methyltransferase
MNRAHGPMTRWVLAEVPLSGVRRILDLGCGGGGAIKRLAALVPEAELQGIDYSMDSLAVARRVNRDLIEREKVLLCQGSVSELPHVDSYFDLALAMESIYFWPALGIDLTEIRRVLAPGARLVLGGGLYLGGRHDSRNRRLAAAGGMSCLSLAELAQTMRTAGYDEIVAEEEQRKGWFRVTGIHPLAYAQ